MLIANDFINKLPKNEVPQETEGYEGFFHITGLSGSREESKLELIVRDHDMQKFEARKQLLQTIVNEINAQYNTEFGEAICHAEIKDQYYNMREKVEPQMFIVDIAEKAMRELGIEPIIKPIRGGTDGSRLSYMGLPCPNFLLADIIFMENMNMYPCKVLKKQLM